MNPEGLYPNFKPSYPEHQKSVKSEKEIVWEKKMAEVNEITDTFGKGIDDKIKETVAAFLIYGFTTSASCEGHLGKRGEEKHGFPHPWVELRIPEPEGLEKTKGKKREKLEQKWRIENLKQQKKMMDLLEEFYQERKTPFDARLVFDRLGAFGVFKIQSFGATMMGILSPEEKQQKLLLYQEEMKAFTEFLKSKYFLKK